MSAEAWEWIALAAISTFVLSNATQALRNRSSEQRAHRQSFRALTMGIYATGDELRLGYSANPNMGYLSEEEIARAVELVNAHHAVDGVPIKLMFSCVDSMEPSKLDLAAAVRNSSMVVPRRARVVSMHVATNRTFVDIVDLGTAERKGATQRSTIATDVQVCMSPEEYENCEKLVCEYPPLRAALAAHGLNPEFLCADTWCTGHSGPEDDPTERLAWSLLCYCEPGPEGNDLPYSRPIEGIQIRISITRMCVISFDDSEFRRFKVPAARPEFNFMVPSELYRTDMKPISITQPEGPSFTVEGSRVQWLDWEFQIGFNAREGLSLHALCFQGRPVLHRASVAEMVVPYGDPREPHSLKNAFDAGEDGMGRNANPLTLGCDCVGYIHYFDGHIVNDDGSVENIPNAICLHEEDCGTAWKHTDWRTGHVEVRRGRRLVISSLSTIANYDYGFYWYLDLSGALEVDVKLTGVLSTGILADDERGGRKYGAILDKEIGLYSPIHQHFFCARLDTAIDGGANRAVELNVAVDKDISGENPLANAFWYETTTLVSELHAERDCNASTSRFWKIQSSERVNKNGERTAYKLIPTAYAMPFSDLHTAMQLRRAKFLRSSFWVTAFNESERYPAGEYPNQSPETDGLPKWTQRDAPLLDADLVVWHVFGVTHLPRLEDWPVMPVEHTGFHFKPAGFMDLSPLMTLPPGKRSDGTSSGSCCHATVQATVDHRVHHGLGRSRSGLSIKGVSSTPVLNDPTQDGNFLF